MGILPFLKKFVLGALYHEFEAFYKEQIAHFLVILWPEGREWAQQNRTACSTEPKWMIASRGTFRYNSIIL